MDRRSGDEPPTARGEGRGARGEGRGARSEELALMNNNPEEKMERGGWRRGIKLPTVLVDVRTGFVSLATPVEFCQGERRNLTLKNRKTRI